MIWLLFVLFSYHMFARSQLAFSRPPQTSLKTFPTGNGSTLYSYLFHFLGKPPKWCTFLLVKLSTDRAELCIETADTYGWEKIWRIAASLLVMVLLGISLLFYLLFFCDGDLIKNIYEGVWSANGESGWDLAVWLQRLTANVKVAAVLG